MVNLTVLSKAVSQNSESLCQEPSLPVNLQVRCEEGEAGNCNYIKTITGGIQRSKFMMMVLMKVR